MMTDVTVSTNNASSWLFSSGTRPLCEWKKEATVARVWMLAFGDIHLHKTYLDTALFSWSQDSKGFPAHVMLRVFALYTLAAQWAFAPRVVQLLGAGRGCHKFVPVLVGDGSKIASPGDLFDQPPGEVSSIRGRLADHVGGHKVLSPEGVVLVSSPGTESSYPCPPRSLKHSPATPEHLLVHE